MKGVPFQKLLIYWDFSAQASVGFSENCPNRKTKMRLAVVLWSDEHKQLENESVLQPSTMPTTTVSEIQADAAGAVVWGFLAHFVTSWASFKCHSIDVNHVWPWPKCHLLLATPSRITCHVTQPVFLTTERDHFTHLASTTKDVMLLGYLRVVLELDVCFLKALPKICTQLHVII